VSFAADTPLASITAAHQVATRFGQRTCGAAVSREPPNDQARGAPRRCAPASRPGGATTFSALFWFSVGAGCWAPNNRLQRMRGLAYFQLTESLSRGPAPLTLCVVRRRRDRPRCGALGVSNRLWCAGLAAERSWRASPPRTRAATRFGGRMRGAAVSCEPPKNQAWVRVTPVRTSSVARRRHHLRCACLVPCWG
jgi:hypothetical protein